jgi:hypothetical protein
MHFPVSVKFFPVRVNGTRTLSPQTHFARPDPQTHFARPEKVFSHVGGEQSSRDEMRGSHTWYESVFKTLTYYQTGPSVVT